jgi:hypothetical protein
MHTRYSSRHVWLLGITTTLALSACSAADENSTGEETQSLTAVTVKARADDVLAPRELATKQLAETVEYEAAPEVQTRSAQFPKGAVTSDRPCQDDYDCNSWQTPPCYRNLQQCYKSLCLIRPISGCTP